MERSENPIELTSGGEAVPADRRPASAGSPRVVITAADDPAFDARNWLPEGVDPNKPMRASELSKLLGFSGGFLAVKARLHPELLPLIRLNRTITLIRPRDVARWLASQVVSADRRKQERLPRRRKGVTE